MEEMILKILGLHPGKSVSLEQMAEELEISRDNLAEKIEKLIEQGYDILGDSFDGFRIENINNIILPKDLQLSTCLLGKDLRYYPRLSSSNDYAKALLKDKLIQEGAVIVAGKQSQGKGRRGRSWESPPGGLWFSVLLNPIIDMPQKPLLSLVFALAVAHALDNFLNVAAEIKWPNDIFVNGKKMAGILLESSWGQAGSDYLISGIGINVNIAAKALTVGGAYKATSILEESGQRQRLDLVLTTVLDALERYYFRFEKEGFAKILDEYKGRCFHLGKNIQMELPGKTICGVNTDIDESGTMIINTGEEMLKVTTGDVSLIEM